MELAQLQESLLQLSLSAESNSKATDLNKPKFSDDSALASMTTAQREERRTKKRLATTTGSTFQGHDPSLIRFALFDWAKHCRFLMCHVISTLVKT